MVITFRLTWKFISTKDTQKYPIELHSLSLICFRQRTVISFIGVIKEALAISEHARYRSFSRNPEILEGGPSNRLLAGKESVSKLRDEMIPWC